MKGHLSEITSVKEDTQELKRVSSNNKEEEQESERESTTLRWT